MTFRNFSGCCVASVLLVFAGGCAEDNFRAVTGSANIIPQVTVDSRIIMEDEEIVEGGGYVVNNVPEVNDFSVILIDNSTGRTAEWSHLSDFNNNTSYHAGNYTLIAYYGTLYDENYNTASSTGITYYGSTTFDVPSYGSIAVPIPCSISCALVKVEYSSDITTEFEQFSAILHVEGGDYVTCESNDSSPVCLNPGEILMSFDMTLPDGRHAVVEGPHIGNAQAAHYYRATVGVEDNGDGRELKVSFFENTIADDIYVPVTDELFTAARPEVAASGFVNCEPVIVAEGAVPGMPLTMDVKSISLKRLILTTRSRGSLPSFWPSEVDLLDMSPVMNDSLHNMGLELSRFDDNNYKIDFTRLVSNMTTGLSESETSFCLVAVNNNGEMSDPLTLKIIVRPVEISITQIYPPLIGSTEAAVLLSAPKGDLFRNLKVEIYDVGQNTWRETHITEISPRDNDSYEVKFQIANGTAPFDIRFIYCDEIVGQSIRMERVAPQFRVEADPFATRAVIKFEAEQNETLDAIINGVLVYNGSERMTVVNRDVTNSTITVGGMEQNHSYTLGFTMHSNPTEKQIVTTTSFRTEKALKLPNGDFEDMHDEIKYRNLPRGGRYSQNYVEIFNGQNYTTHKLSAPISWANTNAKTFCRNSKVHNTWYMQPSCYTVNDAASGAYAVKLVTVGWDIDGFPIPDYLQESQPFVQYSRNIPMVNFASPGQLFLGSYSFDALTCTENLTERYSFNSRPSALNGYYKYEPGQEMPDDRGLARIEVLGTTGDGEIVIAEGRMLLEPSSTYATFSVPLIYTMFGVKATGIRVMLASSPTLGSIADQTNSIRLHFDAATATASGSELWIDALTLSY